MSEKVKVLYFVDRMLRGGIQTFVIENIKHMDRSKIQIDFLLLDDGNDYSSEEKILEDLGCKIYKLNGIWIKKPTDYIRYSKALDDFFSNHNDYKVVHMHSSSKNYIVLKKAKKYNIKVRIAHSHNIDFQTKSKLKKIIGEILKIPLKKYSTHFFACSKIAGEWLFGKNIIRTKKFNVIHNAVDYEAFKFNAKIRDKIRHEFAFKECDIVIGHVGRFANQKNHDFLIDVFYNCVSINDKYKLLLVGTGEKEEEIKEKVEKLGIRNNVIFAGYRKDVNDIMQAMDIFVLPSLYEGLGIVLVEAQASGIPCYATYGSIPEEVRINSNFEFIELKINEWAEKIKNTKIGRIDAFESLKSHGYLIEEVAKELQDFYLNL